MAYDGETDRQPPASLGLATAVQAHLGRASRFVDGKTRNWSLFFFFRVLSKARLAANLKQIALALDAKAAAGVAPAKLDDPQAPAQLFLDWLKVLVDAKSDDFWKTFRGECEKAGIQVPAQVGPDQDAYEFLFQAIEDFSKGAFARLPASFATSIKADVARAAYVTLSNPDNFHAFVAKFGNTPAAAGRKALSGGLLGAFAYELFRQFAPAQARPKDGVVRPAVLRSEAEPVDGTNRLWSLIVKDQINGAASNSRIVGAAPVRNGDNPIASLFLLDAERKAVTLCERDTNGVWQVIRNIPLAYTEFTELRPLTLAGPRPNSVAFLGLNSVAWLALTGEAWESVELDGYETRVKDGRLHDVISGDLNQDGRKDLVFMETAKNHLELVHFDRDGHLVPVNRWQVFEERSFRGRRGDQAEPREGLISDVTGDGKSDLVVIVHDRILVYPQE
jgi:hypothetical protein